MYRPAQDISSSGQFWLCYVHVAAYLDQNVD